MPHDDQYHRERRLLHWRRVMHTTALQWRFLNTVALQQLAVQESRACHQLSRLYQTLSRLQQTYLNLLQKVSTTLSAQARTACAPVLHTLANAIPRRQYDRVRTDVALATRHAVLLGPGAADFTLVLNTFLNVATRFIRLATRLGLRSFAQLAPALHALSVCALKQPCLITDAAHSVHRAATLSERHRSQLLIHHHQQLLQPQHPPPDCSSPPTVGDTTTH